MRNSKSGLFLMEMIIAILVFSISAAVCIQIFVKAYLTSKQTQALNSSVTLVSSAAELFYGFRGDMSKIQHELDPRRMSISSGDYLAFYFDENFVSAYEGSASYCMTMQNLRSSDYLTSHIAMVDLRDNSTIYWLDCRLFLRGSQHGTGQEPADMPEPAGDGLTPATDGAMSGGVL